MTGDPPVELGADHLSVIAFAPGLALGDPGALGTSPRSAATVALGAPSPKPLKAAIQ